MKRKRKVDGYQVAWTPFERCQYWITGDGREVQIPDEISTYRNNLYTVNVEDGDAPPFGTITWLSIKRNDRTMIHDWRELQRIKNAICGSEREAVEIYPRESRLVDTSMQFHLWVFPEGYTIPFGYAERLVIDETVSDQSLARNAKQRAWPRDARPADAITGTEFDQRWKADPAFGLQRMLHKRKIV